MATEKRQCNVLSGPSRELLRDSLGSPEVNRINCRVVVCLCPNQDRHTMIPIKGQFDIYIIVDGLVRIDGTDEHWNVTGRILAINSQTLRFRNNFEMNYRSDTRVGSIDMYLPTDLK